jgi:hypothetical protein
MTKTTVEVERTVREEEELRLCNKCQREVDPDGEEFSPPRIGASPELHFCSECLDNLTEKYDDRETALLREWWNDEEKVLNITRTTEGRFDALWSGLSWIAGITTVVVLGLMAVAVFFTVPAIIWIGVSALCWAMIAGTLAFVSTTAKHLKQANESVFDE